MKKAMASVLTTPSSRIGTVRSSVASISRVPEEKKSAAKRPQSAVMSGSLRGKSAAPVQVAKASKVDDGQQGIIDLLERQLKRITEDNEAI